MEDTYKKLVSTNPDRYEELTAEEAAKRYQAYKDLFKDREDKPKTFLVWLETEI